MRTYNEVLSELQELFNIKNYPEKEVNSRRRSAHYFLNQYKGKKISIHSEIVLTFNEKFHIRRADLYEDGATTTFSKETIKKNEPAVIGVIMYQEDTSAKTPKHFNYEAVIEQCVLSAMIRKNLDKLHKLLEELESFPYNKTSYHDIIECENYFASSDEYIYDIITNRPNITLFPEKTDILPDIIFPENTHYDFVNTEQRQAYFIHREAELSKKMLRNSLEEIEKIEINDTGQIHLILFNLSISIERMLKLYLTCSYIRSRRLNEKQNIKETLDKKNHDLYDLYQTAIQLTHKNTEDISNTPGTIGRLFYVLSKFAISTRYYNLNNIIEDTMEDDPVKAWAHAHYSFAKKMMNNERRTKIIHIVNNMIDDDLNVDNGFSDIEVSEYENNETLCFDGISRTIRDSMILETTINKSFDLIVAGFFLLLKPIMEDLESKADYIIHQYTNASSEYIFDSFEDDFCRIWDKYYHLSDALDLANGEF